MTAPCLTHPSFQHEPVHYGFFTRHGGVSGDSFTGLNCGLGSGDILNHVIENHRRIAATFQLDVAQLVFCKQIHSSKVITVSDPWHRDDRPEADAMVTREKNIILAVMSADCAPVLFHDAQNHIIGAAHSGWKGAMSGVLEETVTAIEYMGGSLNTLHACIGPCIQQESYEVSNVFYQTFIKDHEDHAVFFKPSIRPEHFQFDLPAFVEDRLRRRGVRHVYALKHDTQSDAQQFFSYRRRTLRHESQNGVQMSAIALR